MTAALSLLFISSVSWAAAFQGLQPSFRRCKSNGLSDVAIFPTFQGTSAETFRLPALVYGWDDASDEECDPEDYSVIAGLDTGVAQCSPAGVAVAESLSYDQDRVGSLARLAVAFAPPGQALKLDQIEKVDVICVTHDHIDIQAIICEDGGCVSLAVPVRFPSSCDTTGGLQGCVMQNLDELDNSAQSTLQQKSAMGDGRGLEAPVTEFPSWWVSPPYALEAECISLRSILNEADFQADVRALAQDSLNKSPEAYAHAYHVQNARVAAVGPAGLAFKAQAVVNASPVVLDVMYPFTEPLQDVEALRAAILGAVATAEG